MTKKLIILIVLGALLLSGVWFALQRTVWPTAFGKYQARAQAFLEAKFLKSKLFADPLSLLKEQNASPTPAKAKEIILRVGVFSDSHGATENLRKAVRQMKLEKVDLVLHLGDFTAGGEENYFLEARETLEASGLEYRVLPGDHDFNWLPEHSRGNFEQVFGQAYDQAFKKDGVGVILFENSVEYQLEDKLKWLRAALQGFTQQTEAILFFSPRPLFSPYVSQKQDNKGRGVLKVLRSKGVRYAVAGDTHMYAVYKGPEEKLSLVTVGAIGEYKNPLPVWVFIKVYADGSVEFKPNPLSEF